MINFKFTILRECAITTCIFILHYYFYVFFIWGSFIVLNNVIYDLYVRRGFEFFARAKCVSTKTGCG